MIRRKFKAAFALALIVGTAVLGGCSASGPDSAEIAQATEIRWAYPAEEIAGLSQTEVGEGPAGAVIVQSGRERHGGVATVYLHRWTALPPSAEREAVTSLAHLGGPVIYPAYQDAESSVEDYLPNAVAGIEAALEQLDPRPSALVFVGQSTGGALAFDLAAVAAREGLPQPLGAAALTPGRSPAGTMPRPDYGAIPSSARLLAIDVPGSRIPGSGIEARHMVRLADQVPRTAKRFEQLAEDPWTAIIRWAKRVIRQNER